MKQAMCTQAPCKHPPVIGVTTASVMDALVRQSSCREQHSSPQAFPQGQTEAIKPCSGWDLG